MAKIFAFPQLSGAAARNGLEAFVDDEDLLDFTLFRDGRGKLPSSETCDKNSQNFDWTNQERADLYRAYSLIQAARPGLECDQGVSDEGDPWFLIGDQQGDVFIHICRIDRMYVLDSMTLSQVLTGKNFKSLLDSFLLAAAEEGQEAAEPANVIRLTRGGVLCLHPSMMIAALIWTILLEMDGLVLPVASPIDDEGEGESSTQDTSQPFDIATAASMTESQNILDQENSGAIATDWGSAMGQMQRDEKPLHASALSVSYALTTIATAAGLYTGAQALNILWGSAENQEHPSDIPETTVLQNAHSEAAAQSSVVGAFELLSRFADFDFFKGGEKNISDMLTTLTASSLDAIVTMPEAETLEISSIPEIFTKASALLYSLGEDALANHADATHRAFEASGSDVVMTNLTAQKSIEKQNATEVEASTQQTSFSGATIQNISQTLTSGKFDVTKYNASSLKEWVATADDKLLKSYGILEYEANGSVELNLGDALETTSGDRGAPLYNQLTADARDFIQNKLESSDIEILLFKNEILLFDKAAVAGSTSSISWQLDDGNVISMIGLSAEFSELFVA